VKGEMQMDSKARFIEETVKEYPDIELSLLLTSQGDCGFYELCRKFVDVGLNSDKRKIKSLEISAVFDYGDLVAAKNATIDFIHKNGITDIVSFLEILNTRYPQAMDPSDPRQKTAAYMDESYRFGKFFSFSQLPDDVFHEIIRDISEL